MLTFSNKKIYHNCDNYTILAWNKLNLLKRLSKRGFESLANYVSACVRLFSSRLVYIAKAKIRCP